MIISFSSRYSYSRWIHEEPDSIPGIVRLVLSEEIQGWLNDLEIKYSYDFIKNHQHFIQGIKFQFNDPDHEMLFKLTWM